MALSTQNYIGLRSGRFDTTNREHLIATFDALAASGHNRIVAHFHGGLVSYEAGIQVGENLYPHYISADSYPIFFVWRSDVPQVLSGRLQRLAKQRLFCQLVSRITQFAVARLNDAPGRGLLELPSLEAIEEQWRTNIQRGTLEFPAAPERPEDSEILSAVQRAQFESVLQRDFIINAATRELAAGKSEGQDLIDEDILAGVHPIEEDGRGLFTSAFIISRASTVLFRVLERIKSKRDHGLYSTVVEEVIRAFYFHSVGRAIWGAIQRDTEFAFDEKDPFAGGSAFLEELARVWKQQPELRVTLVGHSTGSIYISNLLSAAERYLGPEQKFDVILLAPASSFTHFGRTITQHVDKIRCTQVGNRNILHLRIFGMADDAERMDAILPGVYPASLLYFVSGVCEDEADAPILGMQRFFRPASEWSLTASSHNEIAVDLVERDCLVWSPTGEAAPGRRSSAIRHGDFDEDLSTVGSLVHLLQHGFC